MNVDTWFDTYKPKGNLLDPYASFDGSMFETFGQELDYVLRNGMRYVWTYSDSELHDGTIIRAGLHYGAIGYFVTEEPWTNPDMVIDVTTEVEE